MRGRDNTLWSLILSLDNSLKLLLTTSIIIFITQLINLSECLLTY